MTEPVSAVPKMQSRPSSAPVVLRILVAIVLAIPGLIGLAIFLGLVAWSWAEPITQDSDKWVVLLGVFGSLCVISFSIVGIGIVLRFARTRFAPFMSLLLALFSAGIIAVAYRVSLQNLTVNDAGNRMFILAMAILGLLVVTLPPFLHWLWPRRSVVAQQKENG